MSGTVQAWMTRREAADHLRVDPKTVDRYVREGKLTRYNLAGGQSVRFRGAEVEALLTGDCSAEEDNPSAA